MLRAGFELKDTEYMILQDFPQEIIKRRRKQMPKLKEFKLKKGAKKYPLVNRNLINSLLMASSFLRRVSSTVTFLRYGKAVRCYRLVIVYYNQAAKALWEIRRII